jgi:Flp pilus assembly protein TadB
VLCLLSGLALLAFTVGYLETSPLLASGLALALAVVLAVAWAVQFQRTRRAAAGNPEV